jgi:lipoprotein-anchoring transpeptidase ErfK/SrfK
VIRRWLWVAIIIGVLAFEFAGLATRPAQAQPLVDGYVARPFRVSYEQHNGTRTLGRPLTGLLPYSNVPVQYFEKGRLEDQRATTADPAWAVTRGRLIVELMELAPQFQISGSTTTYGALRELGTARHAAPAWFTGGVAVLDDGTVFIPFDAQLQPVEGYIVPAYFWQYLNRSDLFPGGWLREVGLPLTDIFPTLIYIDGAPRQVMMQAFERAVLTYDAQNSPEHLVQMGNAGWDYVVATGLGSRAQGTKRIEVSLAEQWLYAYEGDEVVFDAPVATGKDGWETPTGSFAIFRKVPLQDMKGEERGEEWDVKNVPHIMYFREGGFALHGTYWHNLFGTGVRPSHGCVNLPLDAAELLYEWAPLGTAVTIR